MLTEACKKLVNFEALSHMKSMVKKTWNRSSSSISGGLENRSGLAVV